ncbi:MAG: FKBP-type peptidyl-prolyl cis-trans isomerase [Verrucomicrobiota bacterium]
MKKIIATLAVLAAVCSAHAQLSKTMTLSAREYTPDEILEMWGYLLGQQFNLSGYEFNEAELEAIARGMATQANRESPLISDAEGLQAQLQTYFALREERILEEQRERNAAMELDFFDSLFAKKGIQSLGSGLHFEIIEEGGEVKPKQTDWVQVHYHGTFIDGKVFDSSKDKGGPAEFRLNQVIDGWSQGVPQIGEGGKIKLYVPAKLGYGESPPPGIPASATLIFDIELLKILGPDPKGAATTPAAQ